MWSSSKTVARTLAALSFTALLAAAGCMASRPAETDMPWSAPSAWEGTMPLPSGYLNRFD